MNLAHQPLAIDDEPDETQPQAFVVRRCLTAACDGCHGGFPDQAIGHYETGAEMLAAITDNGWTLRSRSLHCPQCATPADPDDAAPGDVAVIALSPSWLRELCCTLLSCTYCHSHLDNDSGQAHFPSMKAAAAAGLSRGWMFAAHQVWCVRCAARVGAAQAVDPVSATA